MILKEDGHFNYAKIYDTYGKRYRPKNLGINCKSGGTSNGP